MTGSVIRLQDLMAHTGLSRSAIYDRMDEKSPRYAVDFPKSFNLGGGAVGWFKSDVDAWLASCAAMEKRGAKKAPSKSLAEPQELKARHIQPKSTSVQLTIAKNPALKLASKSKSDTAKSSAKHHDRPKTLAQAIINGGDINDQIFHHLGMKEWTPAVGAMLVSGINPPLGSPVIPEGGVGLDRIKLHTSDARFNQARRILRDWNEWKEDTQDPILNVEPLSYLNWCLNENIKSEWFRLILELANMGEIGTVDLTASRLALMTNR